MQKVHPNSPSLLYTPFISCLAGRLGYQWALCTRMGHPGEEESANHYAAKIRNELQNAYAAVCNKTSRKLHVRREKDLHDRKAWFTISLFATRCNQKCIKNYLVAHCNTSPSILTLQFVFTCTSGCIMSQTKIVNQAKSSWEPHNKDNLVWLHSLLKKKTGTCRKLFQVIKKAPKCNRI